MVSRIIATVCCRVTTPAKERGALPNTSAVSGGEAAGSRNHEMKVLYPACRTIPIQARCSAVRSRNQGISSLHPGQRGLGQVAHGALHLLGDLGPGGTVSCDLATRPA